MEADVSINGMHILFEDFAQKNPDHIAITVNQRSHTYRELNEKANQLAHYLQKLGVKKNTLVAISLERSLSMLIGILGILKAGAAYVPLDYLQPEIRLKNILNDSQAPILITTSELKKKFSFYVGDLILLDTEFQEIAGCATDSPKLSFDPTSLAYVIYTSGSTGKPKGVLIEHKSLYNYIQWLSHYAGFKQRQRIDFSTNFIFDMAITTSIAALAFGLEVVICSDTIKKDVRQYIKYLHAEKINIIKLTPSYFKILLEEAENQTIDLPDLQSIILGGENLQTNDCKRWLEIYPQHTLFNEYGPTETTVAVSQFKITKKNIDTLGMYVPIGKSGLSTELIILDNNKASVSVGVVGELHIGGLSLAQGYLNQNELTKKRFIPHPFNHAYSRLYKTGDLCRYLPDGNIEYVGRNDLQVKIRGFKVELGEIETYLLTHPNIKEAAVVVREDVTGEKKLIAYCIPKNLETAPNKAELRQFLLQSLTDYMIPAIFVMVERFPLTENGKLDRRALTLQAEQVFTKQSILHEGSELEQLIANIWAEMLDIDQIDLDENFYDLGGHSLSAARIVAKIEKITGKTVSLQDFYNAQTVRKLANFIDRTKTSLHKNLPIKKRFDKAKIIPLSDFQFMFWVTRLFEKKVRNLNIISRKRVLGKLNIGVLQSALEYLLKNHEIFSYDVAKIFAYQRSKKNGHFKILEKDIKSQDLMHQELELATSLNDLNNFNFWGQLNLPNLIVKIFYLTDEISEIQICMPHIFSDDISIEIVFSELSRYYLTRTQKEYPPYKDYIESEHKYLQLNLDRDIAFWETYLKDCELITLPSTEIIDDIKSNTINYSTYFELDKEHLQNLQKMSTKKQISISDMLSAAIVRTLQNSIIKIDKNIFINFIKSTRSDATYDQTIGCFIRLDPFKIDTNAQRDLLVLAKDIQKARLDTSPYQACSSMVKLACLDKTYQNNKLLSNLIKIILKTYTKIFYKLQLNPKILMMYPRLTSLRKKNKFLVNINFFNNFFSSKNYKNLTWCGLKQVKVKPYQYDLSNVDNVLDISFLKDENLEITYLVVSANLRPLFREKIGRVIINNISNITKEIETLHKD